MSDYISREAALEAFENADADVREDYRYGACDWGFGMKNIQKVLNSVPTADVEPVRRWIPCSERLPDLIPCKAGTAYSEKVIVWTTGRKAMVCVWDGKDWFVPYGFWEVWGKDVTHWIPLPKSPEEGDAGNEL